jgi:AAA+ ATPase superfamily predicted ATPase
MNPFIIKGYAGRNWFCDREDEVQRLLNAIFNQRDMTLVSLRKMGKTGLIHYLFDILEEEKKYETIYFDILHTQDLNSFINALATVIYQLKKPAGRKIRDFLTSFRYLRPAISVDPLSGAPTVSLTIQGETSQQTTLLELFSLLRERSAICPIVLAIDEFQQVGFYPERNTEAILRGITQTMPDIRFIFSGSNQSMLMRMFGDATRPFYQSTEMIYLEEIPVESYREFIKQHFLANNRQVDESAIEALLEWTRRHTWYLQFVCNRIFETGKDLNDQTLREVMTDILLSFEPFYLEYRTLLTRHQWQMLKAVAQSGSAATITSGDFIRSNNLTNASTVKRSTESLKEKEMIYQRDGRYFVYDVFLSRWLEMKNR